MSDGLLDRARAGDPEALEELVRRNADWLQRNVRRRLGAALRVDLESRDVVHDAVVQLLQSGALEGLRDEEHLRALLLRIVQGDLVDRHRRRQSRQLDERAALEKQRPPTQPSQHARRQERHALVRRALATLGAEDRLVLEARVWQNHSFAEIAAQLQCSEDAARMRCNRALARLADAAERLLGGESVDLGLSR